MLPVPTGIQVLLRLAALDPAFRRQLTERRGDVAQAAGVELTPSERAILAAIPAAQLDQMAASMPPPPPPRREFLRKTAATAVVLLGGAAMAEPLAGCVRGHGCDEPSPFRQDQQPATTGIVPDIPEDTGEPVPSRPKDPHPTRGITHHEPPPPRPDQPPPPTGIAPDVPQPQEEQPQQEQPQTIPELEEPPVERPEARETETGAAPDEPPPKASEDAASAETIPEPPND